MSIHTVRGRYRFSEPTSHDVLADDRVRGVVARDALRRIAVAAGTAEGENGFTFGLLHAHERELARESRLAAEELL